MAGVAIRVGSLEFQHDRGAGKVTVVTQRGEILADLKENNVSEILRIAANELKAE